MVARKKGWQGEVVVRLVIQPNGSILNIQLLHSSGIALLDRSALTTLRGISERGGIQPNLVSYPLTIAVPIRYRLTS